jgi:hypothetical protein
MSIINWELHQKLMEKKTTITVCTGIGMNMFFPEYTTIEIPTDNSIIQDQNIDPEIAEEKK